MCGLTLDVHTEPSRLGKSFAAFLADEVTLAGVDREVSVECGEAARAELTAGKLTRERAHHLHQYTRISIHQEIRGVHPISPF